MSISSPMLITTVSDSSPFMDLREFLANILGRNVDFTTRNALHPDLKERIISSAIKVFDDAPIDTVAAE
ncbi:MAG: hypothetical protein ACJ8D7_15045 [Xanthobacteraceae bacterium]